MFLCPLRPGQIITNRELMNIFHCACEGGIRYASRTNTIVLVINNTKEGPPNTRQGNLLEFYGRPFKIENKFEGANKRLKEFLQTRGDIFLFTVNQPGQYQYEGKVYMAKPVHLVKDGEMSYPVFALSVNQASGA